jgi:selenocysteine lyase/cysteine desulfurase
MDAAVTYLANLGRALSGRANALTPVPDAAALETAMQAIRAYEQVLSAELLRVLQECGAVVYGTRNSTELARRVPTVCFNLPGIAPASVTGHLAAGGIGIRDGHLYTPRLMARLGLTAEDGAARVSLVHYNTVQEIHRFGNLLLQLKQRSR